MAAEGQEKLVLKPGGVTQYLSNFQQRNDLETFILGDLNLQNCRFEILFKAMDEVKEVRNCYLSINNIVDIISLKDMQQLVVLNFAKNKFKAVPIFCTDEAFPNLKWLDISKNKPVFANYQVSQT